MHIVRYTKSLLGQTQALKIQDFFSVIYGKVWAYNVVLPDIWLVNPIRVALKHILCYFRPGYKPWWLTQCFLFCMSNHKKTPLILQMIIFAKSEQFLHLFCIPRPQRNLPLFLAIWVFLYLLLFRQFRPCHMMHNPTKNPETCDDVLLKVMQILKLISRLCRTLWPVCIFPVYTLVLQNIKNPSLKHINTTIT